MSDTIKLPTYEEIQQAMRSGSCKMRLFTGDVYVGL